MIFHSVIRVNTEEFVSLGVELGDLRLCLAQKVVCSYASAGYTVNPSMTSIRFRVCWIMWPMKERYLHYEKVRVSYWAMLFWN